MSIVATQTEGSSGIRAPKLLLDSDGNLLADPSPSSRTATICLTSALASVFLPNGYPLSVTSDYISFQIWDTIQALSSYVRGMLSTQAMLRGIGVGSATATPASAVVQFFYRDAVGLLAGVLFAALQGSSFDAYAKQWRLVADVANDIGLTAELAAPAFSPSTFLLLACVGSICRAITGCAGGATRMALTQHFALQGNAADIAAKEGSQETAVTLLGMILGLGLTRIALNSIAAAWAAFIAMTVLHVYANVRAMRCLCIRKLNSERLDIIIENFKKFKIVPTPMEVAGLERLMPPIITGAVRAISKLLFGVKKQQWAVVVAPDLSSLSVWTRKCLAEKLNRNISMKTKVSGNSFEDDNVNSGSIVVLEPENKKIYVFILQQEQLRLSVNENKVLVECRQLVHGYCKARYMALELETRVTNRDASMLNDEASIFDSREVDILSDAVAGGDWVPLLTEAGWYCDRPALSHGRMGFAMIEQISGASKKRD